MQLILMCFSHLLIEDLLWLYKIFLFRISPVPDGLDSNPSLQILYSRPQFVKTILSRTNLKFCIGLIWSKFWGQHLHLNCKRFLSPHLLKQRILYHVANTTPVLPSLIPILDAFSWVYRLYKQQQQQQLILTPQIRHPGITVSTFLY